jgi:hypothetical protein
VAAIAGDIPPSECWRKEAAVGIPSWLSLEVSLREHLQIHLAPCQHTQLLACLLPLTYSTHPFPRLGQLCRQVPRVQSTHPLCARAQHASALLWWLAASPGAQGPAVGARRQAPNAGP